MASPSTIKFQDAADKWFNEIVIGMMDHDLRTAIENKANFLAALGLVVYTEAVGGIVTGKLGEVGHSRENFEAALPLLGPGYVSVDMALKRASSSGKDGLYKVVRSGLVHEYFIKRASTVWRHSGQPRPPCAIIVDAQGTLHLIADLYREDLMSAATQIREQLRPPSPNPAMVKSFMEALKLRPAATGP